MARIRQHQHYSDTRGELTEYKDARRGAVEDDFWDEDELIDHRPSSKKKYVRVGCPANDYKHHVYVWVPYYYKYDWEYGLFKGYEIRVCCGCEKRGSGFRKKA